jgi:predicted PurR-regulated permease PerM
MSPPTPKQSSIIWIALTVAAVALFIACLAAFVWALGRALHLLAPVIWPLAMAAALAYLLDPVVDWLEKRNMRRQRAIITVFAIAVLTVAAISAAVVPRLVVETRELAGRVPEYAQRLVLWLETKTQWDIPLLRAKPSAVIVDTSAPPVITTTNVLSTNGVNAAQQPTADPTWANAAESILGWLPKALPALGRGLAEQVSRLAGLFGLIAGLALVPVYCFYFLLEKTGIQRRWTDYLPVKESRVKEEIVFVLTAINDRLIVFFRGQILVAMCDGVLYAIGFFAIGLNYAVLLGLIATVLTIVPFLGAIVTFVIAFILAIVQFQDWLHPLLVIGVFGIVQTLEGLVISPKIIGDRVGLHPLTIIVAVMVGTTLLGGLLGGILAIPLTAALRELMFRYVWKKPTV